MNIGGPTLAGRPGDYRRDENYAQTPQDSLPFTITRGQHNATGANLEHAVEHVRLSGLVDCSGSRCLADRYALRMYSRIAADSLSICCTRCLTTSPIETIPIRRPWATTGT
jgi:hypothetical protein